MAHVIEVSEQGMSGNQRCDRCGAQAYVEVALEASELLFCAHHATESWGKLKAMPVIIADHRPFLATQEEGVSQPVG